MTRGEAHRFALSSPGVNLDDVLTFLKTSSEPEIGAAVDELGVPVVLDVVFDGMAERFGVRPERVPGTLAFWLDHDGSTYERGVSLTEGGARSVSEPADLVDPRATLRLSLVRLLRVAVGVQDPKRLAVTGRLRLSGDVVWAITTLGALKP